jgi:hypothetical protein
MVVLVLERGKLANSVWNVCPVVFMLVLEREKPPTISVMYFLWFSMVVMVLERG